MALQFIYGRAHSGKTQCLFDKAKELIRAGKPVVVVVPEQFTHIAEKRFISKVGSIRYGVAEVMSFDRIAKRINSEYKSLKKPLNAVGKSLIVSEILHNADLEYYTSSVSRPGFVEMCVSEISDMKKYNITPGMLREAAEKITDDASKMKFGDLVKIYEAYEQAVSGTYSDSDDSLGILCDTLVSAQPYRGYTFLFDEFSSFNPSERDVIAALCVQCENVVFAFCTDGENDETSVFRPVNGTADSVRRVCEAAGCQTLAPVILSQTSYANAQLCHLEKNLYRDTPDVYEDACGNIRVFTSENPYAEVMRLASQIISLVRERKVRYRDIGVVCSDISSYSHIFRSVFGQFGIPYFVDEKTRVLDHAVVNFVVNVLDVYINGYNSETVVNFLKSGYICTDKEAIYAVDNFIVATNASKNTWLSDERWTKTLFYYSGGNEALCETLNGVREKYILPLSVLHEKIKGKNTVKDITANLYAYLKESGFCSCIEDFISHFRKENNAAMAKQYESVWKIMIDAFDMLVYILGDKKVNLREYRMYLFTAFGQQKIGIIPTSLDEIVIGDVMRSKGEYAAYQFVVGVNDGLFPSPGSDNGMVDDSDKEFLSGCGIEYSPVTKEKAYFDRFLIYSLFTHPQNSLILSYPLSDSSFSSMRPAFVITMLKNIFTNLKESSCLDDDFSVYLASEESAYEYLASAAGMISDQKKPDERWQDIYCYFKENNPYVISRINKFLEGNRPVEKLDEEITSRLFKKEFYSTVSRLQRYNACRYSYYLEYMLSLKEKETYGLEAVDIGTLIHTIIENILVEIKEKNIPFENTGKEFFEARVEAYIDEYIALLCDRAGEITEREIYSVKRFRDAVVASLMLIRSHFVTSAFKPMGHEIVFSDDNIGCIEMNLDNGKRVKITGKIDRADCFENEDGKFIRVVDYKTGQKTFDCTDVFYGIDIQLLVYLDSLCNMTNDAHPAGALYLQIQSPVISFDTTPDDETVMEKVMKKSAMTGIISEESHVLAAYDNVTAKISNKATMTQFKILGEHIRKNICSNARALSDGEIQINPYYKSDPDGAPSSCVYCPYSAICNVGSSNDIRFRYLNKIDKKTLWSAIEKDGEVK